VEEDEENEEPEDPLLNPEDVLLTPPQLVVEHDAPLPALSVLPVIGTWMAAGVGA